MTGNKRLTRRDFLKLSGSALASFCLASVGLPAVKAADDSPRLGRVAYRTVAIRDIPDKNGQKLGVFQLDDLLELRSSVIGRDLSAYNRTWYELAAGGYVYSGGIQPVAQIINQPVVEISPATGQLAELTVPYTDARWKASIIGRRSYRLYYGTTYTILALVHDERGDPWYQIDDDLVKQTFFIRAEHLRLIPPEELAPISSDVPANEKYLLVSLPEQKMAAYEGNRMVFSSNISSGTGRGETHYASTPTGAFTTFFKRPTAHMLGANFDLPGVPWVSYINTNGIAFHGTYWHNDFGKAHSHGCLNLPSQQAKWLYRWSTPSVPYQQRQVYQPGDGTRVYVFDTPIFSPLSDNGPDPF